VVGDVAENLFTWLALTAGGNDVVAVALVCHVLAAAGAVMKITGVAGAGALIMLGMLRADRRKVWVQPLNA
jgi:hypothetical protein